jgi:predicted transposase YbfD/YdcC
MNYSMFEEAMELVQRDRQIDAMSVYQAFEVIKDGRKKRGVRYPVALVLTLLVLGKLAGMTSIAAVSEWVRLRAGWLNLVLPKKHKSFPCAATYSNVLQALQAEEVNQVMSQWLTRVRAIERCADEPSRLVGQAQREEHRHLALDGKTLRGTQHHEAPDQVKMHQVALYEPGTGLVLKEEVTAEKENELSVVSRFLIEIWVKERIITADALHTQRDFCLSVTHLGGDYVLIAKGNQPTLAEDLSLFFSDPPLDCQDWRTARTVEKGHGRLEIREIVASTELNEFLGKQWAGVAQVFRLIRTVHKKGKVSQEIVYGITSLSATQANAERLLELIRAHWAIENRLHYRRDVTLREDASQVRKGTAPRVQAVLNSFVLALLDFLGVRNVPKQMRLFDAQPLLAVRLLLGSLLTFK